MKLGSDQKESLAILPDQLKPAMEQIFRVRDSFLLCDESQRDGLTSALVQQAAAAKRLVCLIRASIPSDIERLLTATHLDSKTHAISQIPGPLSRCFTAGGVLIMWDPLKSIAVEGLNGLMDRLPMPDFAGEQSIEISPRLQIIAIHITTPDFKLAAVNKSWRDRFGQHRSVPKSLPLPSAAPYDEKLRTRTLDCQFQSADELRNWLHGYNTADKTPTLQIGELAKAVQDNKDILQIKLKNFCSDDLEADTVFQELRYSAEPLEIDDKTYDFTQVRFFPEPPEPLSELQQKTAGKILQRITPEQIQDLSASGDIWLVNSISVNDLDELVYSTESAGEEKYPWRTTAGLLNYFHENGQVHLIVIGPLTPRSWHRLIDHPQIKYLWVLNSVAIPQYWQPLFKPPVLTISPPTLKKTTRESPWVHICVVNREEQAAAAAAIRHEDKSAQTAILHTASDSDETLIAQYSAKSCYTPGILLQLLQEADQRVVITGDTLLAKLPNLFHASPIVAANGKVVNFIESKKGIVLVGDSSILYKYPWLQGLPRRYYEFKESKSSTQPKIPLTGYAGIKQTFTEKQLLIFVSGPKASGKSYSLSRLVKDGIAQVFSYTLSPATTYAELKNLVSEWKQANKPGDTRLRILALDEFTLAKPESLLWLQGLVTSPDAFILPDGELTQLDPDIHRVMGLMNPAGKTTGRVQHFILQTLAVTVEFHPLTDAEITQNVLIPALTQDCRYSDEEIQAKATFLIYLRRQIEALQPGLQLDPRDFLAIIARIASWDYRPPEVKAFEDKHTMTSSGSLEGAILEVVLPQLSAAKQAVFQEWLRLLFAEPSRSICSEWVQELLAENPVLWNISSARRLMASIFGYFQAHSFYQQKQRLIPGKSAVLIFGETHAGKTFLSRYLAKKWGYQFGENCLEWTAGAHGDLLAFIGKAKQPPGKMAIIHEANLLPTAVLEGALNAALTGEAAPGFGLMLTVNIGYKHRQKFSEPLLSRLKILYAQDPTPQELLELYKIPEETGKILLSAYRQAGPSASIRGLMHAIDHYKSGIDIDLACAMVFGLLSAEMLGQSTIFAPPQPENPARNFLTLIGENRLIVNQKASVSVLGELNSVSGVIRLPETKEYPYDLLLLRGLEYQIRNAVEIKKPATKVEKYLYDRLHFLQTLAAVRYFYPGVDEYFWTRVSKTMIPIQSVYQPKLLENWLSSQHAPTDNAALISLCLYWQLLAFINKTTIKWESLKHPQLGRMAKWMEKNNESVVFILSGWLQGVMLASELQDAARRTSVNIQKLVEQMEKVVCPFTPSSVLTTGVSLMFGLLTTQPVTTPLMDSPGNLLSLFESKSVISAARRLKQTKVNFAALSDPGLIYFPLGSLALAEGRPVLSQGDIKLIPLSRHFFPEKMPAKSSHSRLVTMKAPLLHKGNRVPLLVGVGEFPGLLPKNITVVWDEGIFYAVYPSDDQKQFDKPLQYTLVKGSISLESAFGKPAMRATEPLFDFNQLHYRVRQAIGELQKATKSNLVEKALVLCQQLNATLTRLDVNDSDDRQALDDAYQHGLAAMLSLCARQKKCVCGESAFLLLEILQPLFQKFNIPLLPFFGVLGQNSIVSSIGHSYLMTTNKGSIVILDASPSSSPTPEVKLSGAPKQDGKSLRSSALKREATLFSALPPHQPGAKDKPPTSDLPLLAANPLLRFYHDQITVELNALLANFYVSSLSDDVVYRPSRPGTLVPWRQTRGFKNPFKLTVLGGEKRQPQTLLVTSFPSLTGSVYEQFSCVHFLAEILLEKDFKLMVWTQKGAVVATDANHFITLLTMIQPPENSELDEFKYPDTYIKMDTPQWCDLLKSFAKILLKVCDEAAYQQDRVAAAEKKKSAPRAGIQGRKCFFLNKETHDRYLLSLGHSCVFTVNIPRSNYYDVTIKDLAIDQTFIDSFLCSGYKLVFENCQFTEKLDFSKLPYEFRELKFLNCQNIFPDWQDISYNFKSIEIINCSFKDWSAIETEILVKNFTKLNRERALSIGSELLPSCLRLESGSFLASFSIKPNIKKPDRFHLILEEPTNVYGKDTGYDSITILSSCINSPESKKMTNLLNDIDAKYSSYPQFQHLTLVLDIADESLTDYLKNAADWLKKLFPLRCIHLYSAMGVIKHFAQTFAAPEIQSILTI